jgi:hypothetical protein
MMRFLRSSLLVSTRLHPRKLPTLWSTVPQCVICYLIYHSVILNVNCWYTPNLLAKLTCQTNITSPHVHLPISAHLTRSERATSPHQPISAHLTRSERTTSPHQPISVHLTRPDQAISPHQPIPVHLTRPDRAIFQLPQPSTCVLIQHILMISFQPII